jgi:hypothetical protein
MLLEREMFGHGLLHLTKKRCVFLLFYSGEATQFDRQLTSKFAALVNETSTQVE